MQPINKTFVLDLNYNLKLIQQDPQLSEFD
jgi:hypothetical protein